MKQNKIEIGNRLLAEMMGWKNVSENENMPIYLHPHIVSTMPIKKFSYHRSWDALMPVVKYINHTKDNAPEQIWDKIETGVIGTQEIEIAYQGCVEYAQWKLKTNNK